MSDISRNRRGFPEIGAVFHDPADLDPFIGVPFLDGGRDFTGVDCWGLAVLYYRYALGITLPDYRIGCAFASMIAAKIAEEEKSGAWRELEHPELDCIVLMALDASQPRVRQHIGVYVGQGQILHTTASMGASYLIRLDQPLIQCRTRGYFAFTG